jgi:hypothetical protein
VNKIREIKENCEQQIKEALENKATNEVKVQALVDKIKDME